MLLLEVSQPKLHPIKLLFYVSGLEQMISIYASKLQLHKKTQSLTIRLSFLLYMILLVLAWAVLWYCLLPSSGLVISNYQANSLGTGLAHV